MYLYEYYFHIAFEKPYKRSSIPTEPKSNDRAKKRETFSISRHKV